MVDEAKIDPAHQRLLIKLEQLLERAKAYDFHDFRSLLATPKIDLIDSLTEIAEQAKEGMFDN